MCVFLQLLFLVFSEYLKRYIELSVICTGRSKTQPSNKCLNFFGQLRQSQKVLVLKKTFRRRVKNTSSYKNALANLAINIRRTPVLPTGTSY